MSFHHLHSLLNHFFKIFSLHNLIILQFNDSSHNPNAIAYNKDFPKDRRFIQEIEKAVLCLSENQIAVKLYKLPDTIKFCKHKLFDKLKVVDIAEALSYAVTYNLL